MVLLHISRLLSLMAPDLQPITIAHMPQSAAQGIRWVGQPKTCRDFPWMQKGGWWVMAGVKENTVVYTILFALMFETKRGKYNQIPEFCKHGQEIVV